MNKKFIGSDARDIIKKWNREDPTIRVDIEKAKKRKNTMYHKKTID